MKTVTAPIPAVTQSPPMVYWTDTPINYPVADSKYLSHVPFTGDEEHKEKKKEQFEKQLVKIYDGKLHNATECIKLEEEDGNFDLMKYIHVLMEIGLTYGESVFENESIDARHGIQRITKELTKLSEEDLRQIYERVRSKENGKLDTRKPSSKLLGAIRDAFETEETPEDILQR